MCKSYLLRAFIVIFFIYVPHIVLADPLVESKEQAVQVAMKGLGYVDRGQYIRALIVPMEGMPEYKKIVQFISKADAGKKAVKAVDAIKKQNGKVLSRQLISVKKTWLPSWIDRTRYRVIFMGRTAKGSSIEQVDINLEHPSGAPQSFETLAYKIKYPLGTPQSFKSMTFKINY